MPAGSFKGVASRSLPVVLMLASVSVHGQPIVDDIDSEIQATVGEVDSEIARDDSPEQVAPARRGILTFVGQAFRGGAEFSMLGAPSKLDLAFRLS
jgi:hypothetical protein